jgi:hypothetical protein
LLPVMVLTLPLFPNNLFLRGLRLQMYLFSYFWLLQQDTIDWEVCKVEVLALLGSGGPCPDKRSLTSLCIHTVESREGE